MTLLGSFFSTIWLPFSVSTGWRHHTLAGLGLAELSFMLSSSLDFEYEPLASHSRCLPEWSLILGAASRATSHGGPEAVTSDQQGLRFDHGPSPKSRNRKVMFSFMCPC